MKVITADEWNKPYSREKAAFPAVSIDIHFANYLSPT